ncbi:putative Phosphatidylinositol 4-phosphate 5-kinase 9 [Paratrimastix pyriformis]|uniref:Phosphatidylinositol 4-phosphate 5-kinase 9 n=1 Tax=Paratrimastix pyriformis TaxID=342808 RepID=A0ABQ8U802_9EUKA|nr:putative Phosphatidylinositol 4-phosphate 5-kinase 9 [Paratrimastix pyriformis]
MSKNALYTPPENREHKAIPKKQGEDVRVHHVSYHMMLNMQLGIRICVGLVRPKRELTLADFKDVMKIELPRLGSSTTPPHQSYDFKFKDYAPMAFRELREKFGVDQAEFMLSLCGSRCFSTIRTPGKSSSTFFYSHDGTYMIKTMSRNDAKCLRKLLPAYYNHVMQHPHTLLTRFFGLYRVKPYKSHKLPPSSSRLPAPALQLPPPSSQLPAPSSRLPAPASQLPPPSSRPPAPASQLSVHFVVMGNIFDTEAQIHDVFDLKGSTVGRAATAQEKLQPMCIYKDLDFKERIFYMGPAKRRLLLDQLRADVGFLAANNIMDYSLLLGVHYTHVGGQAPRIQATPSTPAADQPPVPSGPPPPGGADPPAAATGPLRDVAPTTVLVPARTAHPLPLPAGGAADFDRVDLGHPGFVGPKCSFLSLFQAERGGLRTMQADGTPGREVLFMGVIDVLQQYTVSKQVEHFFKSMRYDKMGISAIDPQKYAARFLAFMEAHLA